MRVRILCQLNIVKVGDMDFKLKRGTDRCTYVIP